MSSGVLGGTTPIRTGVSTGPARGGTSKSQRTSCTGPGASSSASSSGSWGMTTDRARCDARSSPDSSASAAQRNDEQNDARRCTATCRLSTEATLASRSGSVLHVISTPGFATAATCAKTSGAPFPKLSKVMPAMSSGMCKSFAKRHRAGQKKRSATFPSATKYVIVKAIIVRQEVAKETRLPLGAM